MVHGNGNFKIKHGDRDSILIKFDQALESMAVWRALRIVPFHGYRLDVSAHWMPLKEPTPAVPKIVVEPRSRSPVKLRGRTVSRDG
jgi:hypothetical protein